MISLALAETLFWISLILLFYTWLGYPAVLFLLERCLYEPIRKRPIEPTVSILLCAYNEEDTITAKIANLLDLDYPRDKIEIVVASDGSQDATVDLARRYAGQGVKVAAFDLRRGKPSVINDMVPTLKGEIVLLVDARQRLARDFLRRLVPNFGDETVGGVSGELALEQPEQPGVAMALDLYWRYEKWLRYREAGIDSTLGGTGAVFAFRRALFQPIPAYTILDDVALPLRLVRQGYRVVMEPEAIAWDSAEDDWAREFSRKARTLAGNFQMLFSPFAMGLGSRFFGLLGFEYLSHKVLRLLGPLLLMLLVYANWRLATSPAPSALFIIAWRLQQAFYLLALLGGLLGKRIGMRFAALATSFLVMQVAVASGFLRFASSRENALWQKPSRIDAAEAEARLLRLFLDSSLFSIGMVLAFFIRYAGRPPAWALQSYLQLVPSAEIGSITLAAPFLVMLIPAAVFYFFSLHEIPADRTAPEHALGLIKGVFYSSLLLFLVIYIRRSAILLAVPAADGIEIASMPTSVLAIGFLLNCVLVIAWRFLIRERGTAVDGYLFVRGEETRWQPPRATPAMASVVLPRQGDGETLRHRLAAAFSESGGKAAMVLAEAATISRATALDVVAFADNRNVAVRLLSGDLEILLARSHPRLICYLPLVDLDRGDAGAGYELVKRAVDILLGAAGLTLAPFLLGILLWNRWQRGPLRLTPVTRCDADGAPLYLWRLRYAQGLPAWQANAARLCLLAWHLLRGDLTLVGLPPLSPRRYQRLGAVARRFARCRPGVFHLARLRRQDGYKLDKCGAAIVYYSRHRGPALDLEILLHALPRSLGACFMRRRWLW